MNQGDDARAHPHESCQSPTKPRSDGGVILQGAADGHISIQRHGSQQKGVHISKGDEEVHVSQRVGISDGPCSCLC